MSKYFSGIAIVIILGLISISAFADEGRQVSEYRKAEFQALADSSQLVMSLGGVSDFGTLPMSNRDIVIKNVMAKAAKRGADGIHVFSEKERRGTNAFGLSGIQLQISAEAFKLVEPNVADVRAAIHSKHNTNLIIVQNNMSHIVKNHYIEVGDDLITEVLNSGKKIDIKILMLDTYTSLEGEKAIDGLRQIASSNVDKEVVAHAGGLLAKNHNADGLYEQIVGANDSTAAKFITSYTKIATEKDIPKLRKLMKLHSSDVVRTEAGKALVRLHDDTYVEQMLQAEKSIEVAKAVKKEMLLQ